MMIRTTCKAVNCFSNVARVKYLIVTSHLHLHRHLLLFYIRLGSHFCQQIKHIPLKKMMMIQTTCKAVNFFSNVARVKYLIVTSYLHLHRHLLLSRRWETSHQPTRGQGERTIWRLEMVSAGFAHNEFRPRSVSPIMRMVSPRHKFDSIKLFKFYW